MGTEREGFEPSLKLPLNSISSAAPSTARPSLQLRSRSSILQQMLPICQIIFLFPTMTDQVKLHLDGKPCQLRNLRFDNVPFGRTQFAPTLWTKSVTVGAQSLRPPIDWDIIPTQVPKHTPDIDLRWRL